MTEKTIALLGQPNSGKSTFFNGLTGAKQHVGNWPGKTVEKYEGSFTYKNNSYNIVDLPGTYSLSANSDEEVVTRDYIDSGKADLICIIADASQLNRSMFMVADFIGINVPVILLLNMMDVAEAQGKHFDISGFQKHINIPVVPMIGADKKKYQPFFDTLETINKEMPYLNCNDLDKIYEEALETEYVNLKNLLPDKGIGIYSASWLAVKLVEKDKLAISFVEKNVNQDTYAKISKILSGTADGNLHTADCKYKWIDSIISKNVTATKQKTTRSRFDKVATSERFGKPLAIGVIVLGLICSMIIGLPLMKLVGALFSAVSVPLSKMLLNSGVSAALVSLLCNAILKAISFALQMVCYVFGINLVFGFMEELGYMARISYVFDNTMTKLGLQGKAIMPFLVSFGCNIGGVAGTRVIDSWGQRVLTIALSWVVPCSSTWGVVGLVSGTFFGSKAVFVILSLFIVAFLHIYITYKIFGRSLNKEEERTGLIMELPPYHKPYWKSLFGSVLNKMGSVLKRALSIIICVSVLFWLLSYTPDGDAANSIIYQVGTFIEPVTKVFGLPWQLFMAFIASIMGKEASLGVMASIFNTTGIWGAIDGTSVVNTASLGSNMLTTISKPEALAFIYAFFFNIPCLMALAATAQETHSMKWTLRIASYYIIFALIMATIAYRIGLLIF